MAPSFEYVVPLVVFALANVILYPVALVIYRLYFHPLKHIPGPKIAAMTYWYEVWYDCFKVGQYYFKVVDMHKKYGPIVRINPQEVHIDDPEFYHEIYNMKRKMNKDPRFYNMLGDFDATFSTVDADLHLARRKPMTPAFLTTSTPQMVPVINANLKKLWKRFEGFKKEGKPVNVSNAWRCLATDDITNYALPNGWGWGMLDKDDFAGDYNKQAKSFAKLAIWSRPFPWIMPMIEKLPRWFAQRYGAPGMVESFDFQNAVIDQAKTIVSSEKQRTGHTVLHNIRDSDLPPEQKSMNRIVQDARGLITAGAETTASVLETMSFFVAQSPDIKQKLRNEVSELSDEDLKDVSKLRKLPYLTAVINESLRRATPATGRLPRFDPNEAITYKDTTFAPGTIISMSIPFVHFSKDVFPDPYAYKPDRFFDESTKHKSEEYLIPFNRGSRMCLGREFALNTLYLTIAQFFSKFDLELYETTERDIELAHEVFVPSPPIDTEGVRILVK